jgi:hypothetical protein
MSDESTPREPWVGTAIGREPNGLFAKGNRLATGNPQARRAAELRKVLRDATTESDVRDVWKALTAAAVGGDIVAMRLFLEHTVGKPTTTVEVATTGDAPIQTDITQIVAIIQQEEPDPDRRLKIARRILQLRQQPENTDGPDDGNSTAA